MTVYKGKGEQSSSESPAINFDRSAGSLRLNMGYVDKINRMQSFNKTKTSEIRGEAIFGWQGHNLNKLGRGSQDDATNIISRLLVLSGLGVSDPEALLD